jgi:hypothetical protein
VQPLDWGNGGAIHAMLLSRVELATEFMYDYHFYHHISSPFTRNLRQVFLEQLRQAAPRFIIEIQKQKPWISGIDSSQSFPELTDYLKTYYSVATGGDGYIIHERISDPSQEIQQQQIKMFRS